MNNAIIYSNINLINISELDEITDKKILLSSEMIPSDIQEKFDFYIYDKKSMGKTVTFEKDVMKMNILDYNFQQYRNILSLCDSFNFDSITIQNNESSRYYLNNKHDLSDVEYLTILPIKNTDKLMIFASFNKKIGNRKLYIEILKDNILIDTENQEIDENFTFHKIIKYEENYRINILIIEDEVLLLKKFFNSNFSVNGYCEINNEFEIKLTDTIIITPEINLPNAKIYVWDINDNFIYYSDASFEKLNTYWFYPDNKSYLNGFKIEIKNANDELIYKNIINK